uniref:Uncharacterized protein n=1 Tax=Hemiselmis tepida TaxID=464990 RepID=A0A7S0V7L0_9CRYP
MAEAPKGAAAAGGGGGSGLVECDAAYGVLSSLFCTSLKAGKTASAPHQSAIAAAAQEAHTQQKWTRLPPPKDCSCCKATCAQAGVIHAKVDGRSTTTKYWCKKPSRYTWHFQCATVYDYDCICCDIVRGLYKGQKCA